MDWSLRGTGECSVIMGSYDEKKAKEDWKTGDQTDIINISIDNK